MFHVECVTTVNAECLSGCRGAEVVSRVVAIDAEVNHDTKACELAIKEIISKVIIV